MSLLFPRRALALLIAACLSVLVTGQQDVMFAQTAEQFQEAVMSGIRHIIIKRHLDLRYLSPDPAAQGDCTGIELEGVVLDPQATSIGQCVLLVNSPVFELSNISSQLLLSDVYVRLERTPAQTESFVPLMTVTSGSSWITTTVFRGDRSNCRAVDIGRGQLLHARKSFFVGFEAEDSAAVRVAAGAKAGFKDCTFNINAATLHGSSVGMDSGAIRDIAAACWFQSCIFSSNSDSQGYPVSQTDDRAMHYNNRDFQKSVDVQKGGPPWTLITPEPIEFDVISKRGFLISNPDSYQEIASEQARLTNLQVIEIDGLGGFPTGDDDDSSGPGLGPIVGGIVAAVVVIIGAIAAFLFIRRRRRQQMNVQKHLTEPVQDHAYEDAVKGKQAQHMYSSTGSAKHFPGVHGPHPQQSFMRGLRGSSAGKTSKDHSMISDEARAASAVPGSQPGYGYRHGHNDSAYRTYQSENKSITQQSASNYDYNHTYVGGNMDGEYLEEALDDIYERRILFLGRFELYSQVHRRVGGQGVVQPARGRYDEEEYAIKFFLNRASFEREEALYLREDLRRMMPAVKDIVPNSDGTICDMAGRVFPPAIVIERGEPLDEWALRIEPDFPTILTVLCHILARLQQLHSVGIAHRDIKPGNVLWRPKHHSWTLIDFGCAAEIGQACPLSLSLLYAAPESVHALEAGIRTTVADPATDMWALGVISFELLTASRSFARSMSADDIRAAIAGRAPLPWETHDFRKKNIPELRMLRRSVLSCLNRDPQRRPTSTTLLQSWNGLFDHATKGANTFTLCEEDDSQAGAALPT